MFYNSVNNQKFVSENMFRNANKAFEIYESIQSRYDEANVAYLLGKYGYVPTIRQNALKDIIGEIERDAVAKSMTEKDVFYNHFFADLCRQIIDNYY